MHYTLKGLNDLVQAWSQVPQIHAQHDEDQA